MIADLAKGMSAVLVALVCATLPGRALASLSTSKEPRGGLAAATETLRAAGGVVLAARPASEPARRSRGVTRADAPIIAVDRPAPGQAGYVHYFLMRLPDETLEIQIGLEMPDQRIAWSFPELGAIVSPYMAAGTVEAGGRAFEIWHLYGVRPFPEGAGMSALQEALPARVDRLTTRTIPYCEHDGPKSGCMSCLGFVMRVLFPGRSDDYPEVPRDFSRAVSASRYTTRDLLLYLTGMYHAPTREARLQRIAAFELPELLRDDLEALVYGMRAVGAESAARSAGDAARKRSGARAVSAVPRNAQRKKL